MDQLTLFNDNPAVQPEQKDASKILEENALYGVQFCYNVYQAAALLKVSYKKVLDLVMNCKLDCLKIRGTYRIPWWSLQDYLSDKERIDLIEESYYNLVRVQEVAHLRRKRFERQN